MSQSLLMPDLKDLLYRKCWSFYSESRAYAGCTFSTKENYYNYTTLEFICSPNIASVYCDYRYHEEKTIPAQFVDLNIPLGVRYYIGKKVRFNVAIGGTAIIQISETAKKVSERDHWVISLSLGLDIGTKKSRNKSAEMWESRDIY